MIDTAEKTELALTVSVSPHIRSNESSARIFWGVNLALAPATVMGLYYFGPRALLTVILSIMTAVACEYAYQKFLGKPVMIGDGSAFLTGLLLALNLPPSAPFYIPVIGGCVAILLTKQLFGGLGFNIFNPALLARAFLLISFPRVLTSWSMPQSAMSIDTITCATPLNIMKLEGIQKLIDSYDSKASLYFHLIDGHHGGCIGETCMIAIAIGAAYLLYKKYITWHIPFSFITTAGLLAWIFGGKGALFTGDSVVHLLSGGMFLGAFFMATDYVTSPMMPGGKLLFGSGCGVLTMLIRLKGGYPEGVMFSILIMNCFAPLIDRAFRPAVFGRPRRTGK